MYKEIYLLLTESCPNRCEYCYIKNRDNPTSMTLGMIDKKIKKHSPDRIIFFGGEPLVRLDLMKKVVKKYYGKIKFQVVTSTSINFKEFIEFNREYPLNEVQVSWDGFNNNRIDSAGNNISEVVYMNILRALHSGLKFDIKCVISNDNVKDMHTIHNLFMRLKKHDISGQFVIAHRDYYADDFYDILKEQLPKTFTLDKLYTDHLNKILAYIQKDNNFASCDIGKYTVITPDGEESLCTALSQERKEFDSQIMQEICTHKDCVECRYKFLCDGGCRYERYNKFGADWKSNYLESTCKVTKIYAECIENFVQSLSKDDTIKLINYIRRYKRYTAGYYSRIGDSND